MTRRRVPQPLRLLGRLIDADDRAALADMVTIAALVAVGLLLGALVLGACVHTFRVVAGV